MRRLISFKEVESIHFKEVESIYFKEVECFVAALGNFKIFVVCSYTWIFYGFNLQRSNMEVKSIHFKEVKWFETAMENFNFL